MNRIMIAGTHSGCGKTTVTCGLLKVLKETGYKVSAFKCGPDYIDPMFHREVMGIDSENLDLYFCDRERLKERFMHHAEVPPLAVACHVCGEHPIGQHAVVNRQVGMILLTSPVSEDALSSASFHLSLGETPKIIASS